MDQKTSANPPPGGGESSFVREACFVEEAVRPLNSRRLEIRQEVFCGEKTRLRYQVETWFFLPTSLQVNRWTYPLHRLQQSLKNYIRLGVPPCTGRELRPDAQGPVSGLMEMAATCLELIRYKRGDTVSENEYEDTLKRFALLCRSALQTCRRRMARQNDVEERERTAREFVNGLSLALRRYRKLAPKAQQVRDLMHLPPYVYCDQYISVLASEGVSQLLRFLRDGAEKRRLQAFCAGQFVYRRVHYPETMPEEGSDNEQPAFLWSILKKYVDMPLFLEIRPREGTSILAHSIYGVAAALAMIFATAVAYIGQEKYGQLSSPLFMALVISYIFKDRLKDISRGFLFNLFRRWLPDRRQDLYDGRNQPVGRCKESFRFMDWTALPETVREIRNRTHFVEILNSFRSEDILHYAKEVRIDALPNPFGQGRRSLLDITRLDISDFLRHTEDALNIPGRLEERLVPGEKIYHVDMVRRIIYDGRSGLERFRIVIASSGIRRIDEVAKLSMETENTES